MVDLARRISNTGSKKVIGKFPSRKNRRMVQWESTLERDLLYLLEADPEIRSYQEQPFTLKYRNLKGKSRRYTPDFLVEFSGGVKAVVEVKPSSQVIKPVWQEKFRDVRRELRTQKNLQDFRILTERDIRGEPRLENHKRLYYGAESRPDPDLWEAFLNLVTLYSIASRPLFLGDLLKQTGMDWNHTFYLLFHGYLKTDLGISLGTGTVLEIGPLFQPIPSPSWEEA